MPGPTRSRAADGEEERCAAALDALPKVKWWARNVAMHPAAFWLPTRGGLFLMARREAGGRDPAGQMRSRLENSPAP